MGSFTVGCLIKNHVDRDNTARIPRLVVDTGLHAKHWTRQQMVDYFHEHTAMDDENINTEVDRYIAWPAQALSYVLTVEHSGGWIPSRIIPSASRTPSTTPKRLELDGRPRN